MPKLATHVTKLDPRCEKLGCERVSQVFRGPGSRGSVGNPRTFGPEEDRWSELVTPGWEAPAHLQPPEGERGRIDELAWKSEILGNERQVQVYLPPGYGGGAERYPLLIVNSKSA